MSSVFDMVPVCHLLFFIVADVCRDMIGWTGLHTNLLELFQPLYCLRFKNQNKELTYNQITCNPHQPWWLFGLVVKMWIKRILTWITISLVIFLTIVSISNSLSACVLHQGFLQDQEDNESDSSLSPGPSVQDWLAQARTTRSQHHQDSLQRQRVG